MGTHAGAATVAGFVARAKWRVALSRGAQTASVAVCAAAAVAAAVEFDGGSLHEPQAWTVAALCATLAGAMWWREQRLDAAGLARKLDRRLELGGALFTTLEAQRRGDPSFAALLETRTARTLRADDLPRAAPAPALGWLAAPAIAVGLWLAAAQRRPASDPDLAQLARAVRSALAVSASGAAPLREAEATAGRIEREAEGAELDPAALRRELERLEVQLDAVDAARRSAPGAAGASNARLEALREPLRAAARRLGGSAEGAGRGSPLQSGPGESTMTGSTDDARPRELPADERPAPRAVPVTGPTLGPAPVERGETAVLAGRWWPPEHDAVVAAWRESLELR
jgi:hypothetical protein